MLEPAVVALVVQLVEAVVVAVVEVYVAVHSKQPTLHCNPS